jgi:anti-sigma factor RsiW
MNPNPDEQLLARWLDGEMNADERTAFEARLQSDAALRAEADSLQSLREMLHTGFPQIAEVPHADFFNSQIQERIKELRREEQAAPAATSRTSWAWLLRPWLLGAAAAACALMAVLQWPSASSASATVVLSTYAPNAGVQANTFHSNEANATVLMLDGLESIPADKKVVGYRVHHSETDQQVAMTTMFSEHGEVVMVLSKDGRNQPRVITR